MLCRTSRSGRRHFWLVIGRSLGKFTAVVGDNFVGSSVRPDRCWGTRFYVFHSGVEDRRKTLLGEKCSTCQNTVISLSLGSRSPRRRRVSPSWTAQPWIWRHYEFSESCEPPAHAMSGCGLKLGLSPFLPHSVSAPSYRRCKVTNTTRWSCATLERCDVIMHDRWMLKSVSCSVHV
jgi:hypothetical protein